MKKMTSQEIRDMYLKFFEEKDHLVMESQPLVPKDDPTLLWINSGVATMKKYFDGTVVPISPRMVSSQKAIRANDIENVGVTSRHQTFFEMLGNFSIGDYFKKEAVEYAWEFLTDPKWLGFDKKRIFVTVYVDDAETADIWKNTIGLPEDHISYFEDDNFWEIGEGPSGPCTEIFYDRGPSFNEDTPEDELFVGGENNRYVEIWNVVFSQYNAQKGLERSEYEELPSKNIDTGMGLERVVSIVQGGETNFDTDLFMPTINHISQLANVTYEKATKEQRSIFKLVADHVRTLVFAISDGALPSNEGRGYVLRRLLRRASLFSKKIGIDDAYLYLLVDDVIEAMGGHYTNLVERKAIVQKMIKAEEEKFLSTLSDGEMILEQFMKEEKRKVISGKNAFSLYDTYGFPIELTTEMAAEKGYKVDTDGFKKHMDEQRERARNARVVEESMQLQSEVLSNFEDASEFVGYTQDSADVKPILILNASGKSVQSLNRGDSGTLILDQTPFYATSGGQVSDTGTLMNDRSVIRVSSVEKAPNGQNIHTVMVIEGVLEFENVYHAKIDVRERRAIEKNHTATHLLQYALREVLGTHVEQAGSVVEATRLRFDFTHYEAISIEDLYKIETKVNDMIWRSLPVVIREMPIDEAKALGATALFTEKYGATVRVVQAGNSIELCGGTHVDNTSSIGLFKLHSESGIGSGVRRIEATTAKEAFEYYRELESRAFVIRDILKKKALSDITDAVSDIIDKNHQLQEKVSSNQEQIMVAQAENAIESVHKINDKQVIFQTFENYSIPELKKIVDIIKERVPSYSVFLMSAEDEKTNFVAASSNDKKSAFKSNDMIKKLNDIVKSRGGGRPEMAQATLDRPLTTEEFNELVEKMIKGEDE